MIQTMRLLPWVVAIAFITTVTTVTTGHAQGDEKNNQQQLKMQEQQSAETDVSDEELKKFAGIMQELQQLRQKQMPKMRQAIKDAGLTMKKYRSLQRKMGKGQGMGQTKSSKDEEEVSDEDKEKYQEAKEKVQKVQQGMKQKMSETIQENGMKQQRFREISNAVRSDKELEKRLRKMQQDQRGGQPQQPGAR